jgi:hypothetical protein
MSVHRQPPATALDTLSLSPYLSGRVEPSKQPQYILCSKNVIQRLKPLSSKKIFV